MMIRIDQFPPRKSTQRGLISVVAVLFLITAVVFVLTQTLNITAVTSLDNKLELDGVRALFAAESGAERAQKILTTGTCASLSGAGVDGSLDKATYNVKIDGSELCIVSQGANICTCGFIATGSSGKATRRVRLTAQQRNAFGISGGGTTTASFTLKNSFSVPAIVVFNSAMFGGPGDTGASIAINGCQYDSGASCGAEYLSWSTESAAGGSDAIDDMGVSLQIEKNTDRKVTYSFNRNANWSIVGALLPGMDASSMPTLLKSFWKNTGSDGTRTTHGRVLPATSTGSVSNGVAFNNDACDAGGTKQDQTCKNWCTGGDTMIFGIGAMSQVASNVGKVTFNTANTAAPVVLKGLVAYPVDASPSTPTGGGVYSGIFYSFNPNFADVAAGSFLPGAVYQIKTVGTTSFTSIGAANNNVGTIFTATGAGSNNGTAMPLTTINASVYKGRGTASLGASWKTTDKTACSITVNSSLMVSGQSGGDCIDDSTASGFISSGNSDVNVSASGDEMIVSSLSGTAPGRPIYPGALISPADGAASFHVISQISGTPYGLGRYKISATASLAPSKGWKVTNYLLSISRTAGLNYPQQQISAGISTDPGVASVGQSFNPATADSVSVSPDKKAVVTGLVAAQLYNGETSSGRLGGAGVYSLVYGSGLVGVATSDAQIWTSASKVLNVTSCVLCEFPNGEVVSGLVSGSPKITTQLTVNQGRVGEKSKEIGRYLLESSSTLPATVAATTNNLKVGTPSQSTLYLPGSSSPMAVDQRFAVWSDTSNQFAGVILTATKDTELVSGVEKVRYYTYTVDSGKTPLPTTVDLVPVCVGTCAMFDSPGLATSLTHFKVESVNTVRWAGGFVCARGVDGKDISLLTQPGAYERKTWSELVE